MTMWDFNATAALMTVIIIVGNAFLIYYGFVFLNRARTAQRLPIAVCYGLVGVVMLFLVMLLVWPAISAFIEKLWG